MRSEATARSSIFFSEENHLQTWDAVAFAAYVDDYLQFEVQELVIAQVGKRWGMINIIRLGDRL
jgi:hypothetical protein